MVGPGTGCAMFRAFLQQRGKWKSDGVGRLLCCEATGLIKIIEMARAIFFFGCRHEKEDYLYKEEFEQHQQNVPTDSIFVAFSRDQPQKRYPITGGVCIILYLDPSTYTSNT